MAFTSQNYSSPSVLSWGKIEKYDSPYLENAWRIGTIGDGSCFFHAILTAVDKKYRDLNGDGVRGVAEQERQQRASSIRSKIGRKLTMQNWQTLQKGEPSFLALTEELRNTEKIVSKVLKSPDKYKESKSRSWIYKVVSKKSMKLIYHICGENLLDMTQFGNESKENGVYKDMKELKQIFTSQETKIFVEKVSANVKSILKKFDSETVEKAVVEYRSLMSKTFDMSGKMALQNLVDHFTDPSEWIGTEYLVFLSDQFDVNIIVIDGQTKFPYITADLDYIKNTRQTILLLAVNQNHYECIATQLSNTGKRAKITCKFKTSNETIQKILCLMDKQKAFEKYPNLARQMYNEPADKMEEDSSDEDDGRLVYSDSENEDSD